MSEASGLRFDPAAFPDPRDALQFVMESSSAYALVGSDLQGRVTLWSRGAEELYGYPAADALGRVNTSALFAPDAVKAGKPREMRDGAVLKDHDPREVPA